jgi:hypothetical protein
MDGELPICWVTLLDGSRHRHPIKKIGPNNYAPANPWPADAVSATFEWPLVFGVPVARRMPLGEGLVEE